MLSKRLINFMDLFTFDPSVGLYETPPEWVYYRESEQDKVQYNVKKLDVYASIKDLYELN